MSVRGIVTVEPGRIVDDRTIAIQDATAGILVRLDGGRKDIDLPRGTEIIVEGRLTARYGTLEVRLDGDDPLEVLGSGVMPEAQAVRIADLSEATEGRLVVASGIVSDVDRAKSGTTTIMLEDASGRGRIVGFAGAGNLPDALHRGAAIVATGISGQRASATGRLDGYRIWVRDGSDIEILAPASTPTPSASTGPTGPTASPSPTLVTIAVARTRTGDKVTVEGTVTSQGGLLDADGRRVTIQDATAGILLRVAAREKAPPVGSRIRAVGSVGTYYGAPQLSASGPVHRLGSAIVSPRRLTAAPGAGLEWELVRVEGTVTGVKRTGQSWRAELAMAAGARVPIVGLTRAGISASRIEEGQHGAIVGIVRRAYPTATDRRFAVVPRGRADLDLSGAAPTAGQARDAGVSNASGASAGNEGPSASPPSDSDPAVALSVDAGELPTSVGRLVRVGGLVVRDVASVGPEAGPAVVIEDATGLALVRFPADAAATATALAPGDLMEAIGIVQPAADGGVVLVVDDAADVVVAGQAADVQAQPAASVPADDAAVGAAIPPEDTSPADQDGLLPGGQAAPVTPIMGVAGAGLALAGALAAVTRWRRHLARRRASRDATGRLVELLSAAQAPPVRA